MFPDTRPHIRQTRHALSLSFAVALAACGGAPAPEADRPVREVARSAATEIRRAILEDGRGGAALGIFVEGEAVFAGGFGLADPENGTPAKADHLFRIGSITKPVTAMAMLRLIEAGRARRSDPVARFVPELARVRNPKGLPDSPTLFQLATMTGGLAREPDDLPRHLVGAPEDWLGTTLRALGETSFTHEPGTRYQYSNIGYATLGVAVERAAGEPFLEHARRTILEPLGMDSTIFYPEDALRGRIAAGIAVGEDGSLDLETPAREHAGRGYKVPNGALYSTVGDLGVFLRFLTGAAGPPFDAVIPAPARKDNLTRAFAAGDLSFGYGFGFMSRRLDDADGASLTAYGHGGSVAGYRAAAWIEPETGVAVVLLRNVGGDGLDLGELAGKALGRVVAALLGEPAAKPLR